MFREASTLPAPSPYGTAQRQSIQKEWVKEKANNAAAVMPTLTAVTFPVPNLRVRQSLCRLEMMVPRAMIMEMMPA